MTKAKMLTARMRCVSDSRPDQRSARSRSSFLGKTVAHAVKRLDRAEIFVDGPEFAPKALDVAVDGTIVDIDVVLIGYVHQLVARFDDAGALRERFEDHELRDGQRHVLAPPVDTGPSPIHGEPTPTGKAAGREKGGK